MNCSQKSRFTTLVQVLLFITRYQSALGAVILSRALAALREAVAEVSFLVTAQWVAQSLGLRLTQIKAAIREDLRIRHMRPIAGIALAILRDNPVLARIKVPRKRDGDAKLLAGASAMAAGASRHRNVFLPKELPADFITQLRHAASEIQRVLLERSQALWGHGVRHQRLPRGISDLPCGRLAFSAGSEHTLCCQHQRVHFQIGDRQWTGISGWTRTPQAARSG